MTTVAGDLVGPAGVRRGWVTVEGDRVVAVGRGDPPRPAEVTAGGGFVLPGLVDAHCHGALGESFGDGPEGAGAAADHHHRSGSTTVVGSLVSAPPDALAAQVRVLAGLVRRGVVDGIHLEGPYLSAERRGAHVLAALRDPDAVETAGLLRLGGGGVRTMTLAPELPGALELISELVASGVRVAVGHTAATWATTRAAVDAGASVATHLFNGMPPIHHRAGGPVVALLADPRVVCELVVDGHHLSDEVVRWVWGLLGDGRRMLVSDASAATGLPDGSVLPGAGTLTLSRGRVEIADGGVLAGSATTLMGAVRRVRGLGVPLHEAVTAAALTPARAVGLADRGKLAPGARADLVLTDADLAVQAVMRSGAWLQPTTG